MMAPSPSTRSASTELLLVSSRQAGSGQRRSTRQITPTLESSHPTKLAIIVKPGVIPASQTRINRSSFSNPLGWSVTAQQARIDARFTLYDGYQSNPLLQASPTHWSPSHEEDRPPGSLPNPLFQDSASQSHGQFLQSVRRVILPFDLREDPTTLWTPENSKILRSLFPQCRGFGTDGYFFYIYQDPIPAKPWPITVAGLPLFIAPRSSSEFTAVPNARPAHRRNGSIGGESDLRGTTDRKPLFLLLRDHFCQRKISVTEIMYWVGFVLVVLEHRETDLSALPWKAANVPCRYLFEDEMGRPPTLLARRQNEPTPGNPDQTVYDNLQPGLRISSNYIRSQPGRYYSTTSGVLIKDQNGDEFMTAAAHGFPTDCGTCVLHALPSDGREIGEVIHELPHTDIALVKLRPDETFRNISFTSEYIEEPIQLKRLAPASSFLPGPTGQVEDIVLDSPDSGCIDGTLMRMSYQCVTDDDSEPEQHWVETAWWYMGQNNGANLPDGICGSAIWTEKGDVMGFFRYAPTTGAMRDWCCGISSVELIQRGYTLVDTTGR